MSAINLKELSDQGQKTYAYLDRKGAIFFDQNTLAGWFVRPVATALGYRNYNISLIIKGMQSKKEHSANIEFLTEKLAKKAGLSKIDYRSLELLGLFYKGKLPPSQFNLFQKELLRNFIETAIGNSLLNERLSRFKQSLKGNPVIHPKALEAMLAFSHKTKKQKELSQAVEKIKKTAPLLTKKGISRKLKIEDKLSHRDLIVIEESAKLAPVLQDFKKMHLYASKNKPIGAIAKQIHIAANFINRVHKIAERQAPHKKGGVLIFYDTYNFAAKRTFSGKLFDKLVFNFLFRTPIFHASIGYQDRKNRDIEADIWARFRQSRRSLYSRTFKTMEFDFEKLAESQEAKEKLKSLYGKNWVRALESKFQRILREYYGDKGAFKHLYNPPSRRLFAGLGFRWSPFRQEIEDRIQFNKTQSVCSEFATKSFMQCFFMLQEEVKANWQKSSKRIKEEAPKLYHPVRDGRRLNRVTPHEMTRRLLDTGFAKESAAPSIIKDLIKLHEYTIA